MQTSIRPILAEQLNPTLLAQLQQNGLYRGWTPQQWLTYVQWALIDNPFRDDAPMGYGLYSEDELIAYIAFTYYPFLLQDKPGVAASCGDFCAFPRCNLQDTLAFANYYFKQKPSDVIVGFHASQATSAIWRRYGAQFVYGGEKTFSKSVNLSKRLWQRIKRTVWGASNKKTRFKAVTRQEQGLTCELVSGQDIDGLVATDMAAIETLFQQQYTNVDLATLRSAQYLQWRYFDTPLAAEYGFIKVMDADTLVGFAVVQRDNTTLRMCEFVAAENPAVFKALLASIHYIAKQLDCFTIVTKIVAPAYEQLWRAHGFELSTKTYNQFLFAADSIERADYNGLFSFGDFKLV